MTTAARENGLALAIDGKMSARCCGECIDFDPDCSFDLCDGPSPQAFWLSLAGVTDCTGCIDTVQAGDRTFDNFAGCNQVNGMYYVPRTNQDVFIGTIFCLNISAVLCQYINQTTGFTVERDGHSLVDCEGAQATRTGHTLDIGICPNLIETPPDELIQIEILLTFDGFTDNQSSPFFYAEMSDSALNHCTDLKVGGSAHGLEASNLRDCDTLWPPASSAKRPSCQGGSVVLYPYFPCDGASAWSNLTSYLEHDVVTRSSECYVAKIDNINKDPLTSPDEWAIFG